MAKFVRISASVLLIFITLSSAAAAKKTDKIILTSFYPMYIMTINIAVGVPDVKVINMTKPQTGCLHDYQLTPQDMKSLSDAWTFVANGGGMESFLEKIISGQKGLHIIDASRGIELIREDHEHEQSHSDHGAEVHDHEVYNPHIWVSVSGAIAQVKNIRDGLISLDSANASIYRNNGDTYIANLESLRKTMHDGLAGISIRNIITFHEAFPYFAREFNLDIVAIIEREPGSSPSAGELAQTVAIVKKHNIKALFAEPQYPAKAAETIARETGATLYSLDPAVTGELLPDAYIDIMERNLKVLQKALK